jgi:hypothetical protein
MVARTIRQTMHNLYNFHTRNKAGSVVIRLQRVASQLQAGRVPRMKTLGKLASKNQSKTQTQ